jgi:hypothetical protein
MFRSSIGDGDDKTDTYYQREAYLPNGATIGTFSERLSGVIGTILAGEFPAMQSRDCTYCDYGVICEPGAD